MANEPQTVVIGNLTEDVTLRFTASGRAVANVSIANNPRNFNKQTQQWEEGETWFVRGSVWGEYAENAVESLTRGMQVMAWGRLVNRTFEDKQGNQRNSVEMQIDEIGPTLRFATAQVNRTPKQGGGFNAAPASNSGWGQPAQQPPQQSQPGQGSQFGNMTGAWGDQSQTSVWADGGQLPQQGEAPF